MNLPIDSLEFSEDRVHSVGLRWGMESRPLWHTLENMSVGAAIKWVDRFSTYEGVAAEWALAQAFEVALNIEVPHRAGVLRFFHCEIQRLLWGFQFLSNIFESIHDSIRREQALYLRELTLSAQEMLSGARVLPQALRLGGIDRDLTPGDVKKIRNLLQQIESEMLFSFQKIEDDYMLKTALEGVLPLHRSIITWLNWGGPVGLSTNFSRGERDDWARALKLNIAGLDDVDSGGIVEGRSGADALERFRAGIFMIRQTLRCAGAVLLQLPSGPIFSEGYYRGEAFDLNLSDIPHGRFVGYSEAGSGLVSAAVGDGQIRLSSSSTRVAPYIELLLRGVHRDDLNVAIASLGFDLCEGDLAP